MRGRGVALGLGLLLVSALATAQSPDGGSAGVTGSGPTPVAQVARPLVPAVLVLALLVLGLRRFPGRVGQALRASRRLAADDPAATADLPDLRPVPASPGVPVTPVSPVPPSAGARSGQPSALRTQGVNARTASRHGEGGPSGQQAEVTVTAVTLSLDCDVRGRLQVELDALVGATAQAGLGAVCTGLQGLLARNLGAVSAARVDHAVCEALADARPRFEAWVQSAPGANGGGDPGALVAADEGHGQVVVTVVVARRQGPGRVDPPRDLRALRGVLEAVLVGAGRGAVLALEVVVTPEEARWALTEAARGQRFVGLTSMRAGRPPR